MFDNGDLRGDEERGCTTVKRTSSCAIDHAHLRRYTMGDQQLEQEVLELFAGELPRTLRALIAARTEQEWKIAIHTLKGSARAVGAWRVAAAAGTVEKDRVAFDDPVCKATALAACELSATDAIAYIRSLTAPA